MSSPDEYDGPRAARADELDSVIAHANRVFRRGRQGGDMGREFPTLFCPDRLEQLRIFARDGQCVSLIGAVVSDVVLLGCSLKVVCIGAVSTDEAHRGHGLAGRALDDAVRFAVGRGASIMLISGRRSLYVRRGAHSVGRRCVYRIAADRLPPTDGELEVSEVTAETAAAALRLFEAEPIRFRRDEREYVCLLACGAVMNRPGRTWLAGAADEPLAVLSANPPRDEPDESKALHVRECAGDRATVAAAAAKLARERNAAGVEIDAYTTDIALRRIGRDLGGECETASMSCTLKLLDAERLWADFAPLLAERLGQAAAAEVRVSPEADELQIHTLTFERGGEQFEVRGAHEVTAALFGADELDPLAAAPGPLGETLRRALPLPLPMYGLNYI